ncbi:PEP-CTERM sorting domain-containing protein [Merismopedia glauca]|nr:PEP-CTERM sorting domain-containing protein [Merismopedia glauca]
MTLIKKLLAISVGAASLTLAISTEAQAAVIGKNIWYQFFFEDVGVAASSCVGLCEPDADGISEYAPDSPWEFVVDGGGAFLTIQDAFLGGDQFSAYNNGVLLGKTSTVPTGGDCSNDLLACISDPEISQGKFFLAAGSYSLDIFAEVSPFNVGAAFFRVDPIPEPTTILGTLAFSALGAGAWLKRRKKIA